MSKENRIRVVIVEDHAELCQCLRLEVNRSASMHCVGAFQSLELLLSKPADLLADVLLLDLSLPGMDGIEGAAELKHRWPRLKIIIFSADGRSETIFAAFMAGADGYLIKCSSSRQRLAEAITMVHGGGSPLSSQVADELVKFFQKRKPILAKLSPTERAIVESFDRGAGYKEIGERLQMSVNTVKAHVQSILRKTGLQTLREVSYLRRQVI